MVRYTQLQQNVMATLSGAGMIFSCLVGGVTQTTIALLIFIVADYITGMLAAWKTNSLDSQKGFEGVRRKIVILMIVILAHWLDVALKLPNTFKDMTMFAYIGNEGISIFENLDRMGYSKLVPAFLRDKLIQIQEMKEDDRNE